MASFLFRNATIFSFVFLSFTFAHSQTSDTYQIETEMEHSHEGETSADEALLADFIRAVSCIQASPQNLLVINQGIEKFNFFLNACAKATNNSRWCAQLTRPNPSSYDTFACTYGSQQPHILISPDQSTWASAFKAVQIVEDLESLGIEAVQIYNWWRPEPYNKNVGGASGRHPFGTSVDVRFLDLDHTQRAHAQLCKWRKQGRLRALGSYGTTGLHLGIDDRNGNTWGKSCPK